jgi:hypothetical protein
VLNALFSEFYRAEKNKIIREGSFAVEARGEFSLRTFFTDKESGSGKL